MSFLVSDMPLSFTDDTPQEVIERRRAERIMARKESKDRKKTSKSRCRIVKAKHREKDFFPNLTGEFDEKSPFAKHFTRKRD
jgi:hypothetical protein